MSSKEKKENRIVEWAVNYRLFNRLKGLKEKSPTLKK